MGGIVYLSYANSPDDPQLVHLRAEKKAVTEAFRPLVVNKEVILDPEDNTELIEVLSRLGDKEYAQNLIIFGFSGHAGGERLMFNDQEARGQGLAALMSNDNCPRLKVVFLNGCVTYEHLRFFEENYIPIIITTNASVRDEKAKDFSTAFFRHLVQGYTIYQSYRHAFATIQTGQQVEECIRCYRDVQCFDYPDDQPVWEFAFREERFKDWTLKMGMDEPPELFTLQGNSSATIRLLFFGDKYFEEIRGQLSLKTRDQDLALAHLPLNSIINERKRVEEEINHTNAIVFYLQQGKANEIFKKDKVAWLIELISDRALPVALINEDCALENIKFYQELFSHESPVVIPDIRMEFNLALLYKHNNSSLVSFICSIIEKEIIVPILKNIGLKEQFLLLAIEDFDLTEQIEYFKKIPQKEQLNFLVLEGTKKCGLELLTKRVLDYLSWKPGVYHTLKFDSREGVIETKDLLFSKLFSKLTGQPEQPIKPVEVASRLAWLLETQSICLILDNPFVGIDHDLIIECWETLCKPLIDRMGLHRLIFIVINKLGNEKCWPTDLPSGLEKGLIGPNTLPLISEIEKRHFDSWWGRHASRIRKQAASPNLDEKVELILSEPFLGSVLEKLCLELNHPNLIDKLLPNYE